MEREGGEEERGFSLAQGLARVKAVDDTPSRVFLTCLQTYFCLYAVSILWHYSATG